MRERHFERYFERWINHCQRQAWEFLSFPICLWQVIHPTFKVDELERTINGIKAESFFSQWQWWVRMRSEVCHITLVRFQPHELINIQQISFWTKLLANCHWRTDIPMFLYQIAWACVRTFVQLIRQDRTDLLYRRMITVAAKFHENIREYTCIWLFLL